VTSPIFTRICIVDDRAATIFFFINTGGMDGKKTSCNRRFFRILEFGDETLYTHGKKMS